MLSLDSLRRLQNNFSSLGKHCVNAWSAVAPSRREAGRATSWGSGGGLRCGRSTRRSCCLIDRGGAFSMTTANGRSARVRRFVTRRGAELAFTELGFGGGPLGNLYRPTTEKEARLTLETVWASGCRYFDTAPLYGLGLSETRLNGFLRPKPRNSYLISTKVGRLLDSLQAAGALAAEHVLRNAVAPRALRLFLRRRDAVARIFARAPRPRLGRHRVRP